ncbi:MAG: DnaJ domain-containing protein [Candidatus Aminicenantes bacterium]|nr:DnaJ domain-containing protein [Candidatus Aminicenantes bacterium]
MGLKKIEELNHYEVLNVNKSASQQEIEKAYTASKAAYQRKAIAHYNLVSENERKEMLTRIEKAYLVLSNPKNRRRYDLRALNYHNDNKDPSFFRQSTKKLVIEDGEKKSFWAKLKSLWR